MVAVNQFEITQLEIKELVQAALKEDLSDNNGNFIDISSSALADSEVHAEIISREQAMLCGQHFANEVLNQVDSSLKATWQKNEGEIIDANQVFLIIEGNVKSILKAERTLLNFLQFLSAVATKTNQFKQMVAPFGVEILDTRKTIPTLRAAQKYATRIGGAKNHRFGLFDAILLKENHLIAGGGVVNSVNEVHQINPSVFCEVEVENIDEFNQALLMAKEKKVHRILLDEFSIEQIKQAVQLSNGICPLEVSGGVKEDNIINFAKTGIDFISLGTLTKNIKATDLSLRITE